MKNRKKIEDVLEDQIGYRRGRETGMLRMISERTLDMEEEFCACSMDWQKVLYMVHSVKMKLDEGETKSVEIGRGVRQGCCLSPILFKLHGEYLKKEDLERFGDFKIGGQVIRTVKCADDVELLAKEKSVLQGVIERLTEMGRCYGTEMKIERN